MKSSFLLILLLASTPATFASQSCYSYFSEKSEIPQIQIFEALTSQLSIETREHLSKEQLKQLHTEILELDPKFQMWMIRQLSKESQRMSPKRFAQVYTQGRWTHRPIYQILKYRYQGQDAHIPDLERIYEAFFYSKFTIHFSQIEGLRTYVLSTFENGTFHNPEVHMGIEAKIAFKLQFLRKARPNYRDYSTLQTNTPELLYARAEFESRLLAENPHLNPEFLQREVNNYFGSKVDATVYPSSDFEHALSRIPPRLRTQLSAEEQDFLRQKFSELKPFQRAQYLELLESNTPLFSLKGFRDYFLNRNPANDPLKNLRHRYAPFYPTQLYKYEQIFYRQTASGIELSPDRWNALKEFADQAEVNDKLHTEEFQKQFDARIIFDLTYLRILRTHAPTLQVLRNHPKSSRTYASARTYFQNTLLRLFPDAHREAIEQVLKENFDKIQNTSVQALEANGTELPAPYYTTETQADISVSTIYEFYKSAGRLPEPQDPKELNDILKDLIANYRITRPDYVYAIARLKSKIPPAHRKQIPRSYFGEYRLTLHEERLFSNANISEFLSKNKDFEQLFENPQNKTEQDLNALYKFVITHGRFPRLNKPESPPADFSPIQPDENIYFAIVKKIFSEKSEFINAPELRFSNLAGDPHKSYREKKTVIFKKIEQLTIKIREQQLGLQTPQTSP